MSKWMAVTIKNKATGESLTLYHPPGNCEQVDRQLRYKVLDLPAPENSPVTITALNEGAEWITQAVPAHT